jgi:FtsH-binding integral membrane protein
MSFIFLAYTMESISSTFFTTAGTFAIMSLIGYTTKRDLSGIGKILTMLLIGLVVATVVNIFVGNSGLSLILNYVGVVVFVGLTAYDTQKIKALVHEASMYGDEEQTNKLALMGSLTLYLDFINLFLYLLRFLGNRK